MGEAAGTPVAFGLRYRPGRGPVRLLGGVAPDRRGRGIGRALLGWQLRDAEGAEPDAPLSTLRSAGDQGAAGLARRFGFVPEREFLTMRRRLDQPIEPPSAVLGVRVTALPPELDEAVRQAKNAAFRDHWQSSEESAEEWVHRAVGPRLDRERSRIALVGEEVAGFVVAWLAPERPGEVYVLLVGTISRWRGRGVATMLLTEVLLAGAADGRSTAVLDVDAANSTGARRVYSHVGFQTVARATVWGLARR